MPESESKPKPTLEELLQLKRAERPPAEFWDEFERDLHRRTLHTLFSEDKRFFSLLYRFILRMQAGAVATAAAVVLIGAFAFVRMSTLPETDVVAVVSETEPVAMVAATEVEQPAEAATAYAMAQPWNAERPANLEVDYVSFDRGQTSLMQNPSETESLSAGQSASLVYWIDTLAAQSTTRRVFTRGSSF